MTPITIGAAVFCVAALVGIFYVLISKCEKCGSKLTLDSVTERPHASDTNMVMSTRMRKCYKPGCKHEQVVSRDKLPRLPESMFHDCRNFH